MKAPSSNMLEKACVSVQLLFTKDRCNSAIEFKWVIIQIIMISNNCSDVFALGFPKLTSVCAAATLTEKSSWIHPKWTILRTLLIRAKRRTASTSAPATIIQSLLLLLTMAPNLLQEHCQISTFISILSFNSQNSTSQLSRYCLYFFKLSSSS